MHSTSYYMQIMNGSVEPSASKGSFSAEAGGLNYIFEGKKSALKKSPDEKASTIGIYDPQTEQWTLQPTTGPPPSGVYGGKCVSLKKHLYCFGGSDRKGLFFHSDLRKLSLDTYHWSENLHSSQSEWPICKVGFGLVVVDDETLCCFGGFGFSVAQQSSTFIKDAFDSGQGWTNELHFFDIHEGNSYYCMHMA